MENKDQTLDQQSTSQCSFGTLYVTGLLVLLEHCPGTAFLLCSFQFSTVINLWMIFSCKVNPVPMPVFLQETERNRKSHKERSKVYKADAKYMMLQKEELLQNYFKGVKISPSI